MAALEVLTDEGAQRLGYAAASGSRLVVEYACVGSKADLGVAETVKGYARLKASDEGLAQWRSAEGDPSRAMPCVAMLPSQVALPGEGGAAQLDPRNAIDVEFSWLPQESVEFDAIAVFARLYSAYAEYAVGTYVEGQVVWFRVGDNLTYYRCIADVEVKYASVSPAADPGHWTAITVSSRVIGTDPPMRAEAGPETLILLHISTVEQPIKVASGVEFNYKLRIFLDSEGFDLTGQEPYPVYLESLVPAGQAAMQLDFLKEMALTMRSMRDLVTGALR